MTSRDERLKILGMIAQGKITPQEGDNLLKALAREAEPVPGQARWLCVRVMDSDSGEVHVNVRIPVGWAGKLLNFVNRFARYPDIDMEEVQAAIRAGEPGQIILVDTDDGNRVEIWLEV